MGSFFDKIFGTKPEVAPFIKTDLQEEQTRAVEANRANLEVIGELADETAARSGQATRTGIESVTPGGTANIDKATEQVGSFLKGEIPDDVADEIIRRTAELSTQRGVTPRSGIGNNFTSRELGLTSLNLVNQGISMAESWMKTAQGGFQSLNFGSMFISPTAQAEFTLQQREAERSLKQAGYNLDAAGHPVWAGIHQGVLTAVGAYFGGAKGAQAGFAAGQGAVDRSEKAKGGLVGGVQYSGSPGGYQSATSSAGTGSFDWNAAMSQIGGF